MSDSIDNARTETERGRALVSAREFKAAMKRFKEARRLAETEMDKAYALLGDEECQLHLRLPADDGSEALEAALVLLRANGDKRAEAWALICLGIRAQSRRDFNGAVACLDEAANIAGLAGEREAEARALLDKATMLTFRREPGDLETMKAIFDRGDSLAAGGDAYERAVAAATRGIVRYASGDFAGAVLGYRSAASGFSSIGMPEQALETSVALGVALYRAGDREESERIFLETKALGLSLGRNVETGVALMYLGQLAENSSRYAEAFNHYNEAERRLGPDNMYGMTLRLGQARALCAMGRYAEAWARLGLIKGELSASTRVGLPMLKASALSGMGRYAEAAEQADLAVSEAASRGMTEREADARAVRMRCRQKEGAIEVAEKDARAILGPLAETAAAAVKGKALSFLAAEARKRGAFEEASERSKAACDLLAAIDAPLDLAHAQSERGRALLALGDRDGAGFAFEEACRYAMAVRRDAPEAYRRDFLDSLHAIFSVRIEFLIDQGNAVEAYRAVLRFLARTVAERFRLTGEEDPPEIGDAAEFIFLPLERGLAVFSRSARGLSARLAKVAGFLPPESLGASVDGGCVARGFFLTEHGKTGMTAPPDSLSDLITRFKDEVRNGGASFRDQASALYTLFFAPDEAATGGCRRWILCPAGILSTFPFEALLDGGGSFILEKRDILYAKTPLLAGGRYSSAHRFRHSVLAVGDPLSPAKEALVGDPDSRAEDSATRAEENPVTFTASVLRMVEEDGGRGFPRLPGAAREARFAYALPGDNALLLGVDATKKKFIEALAAAPWGILHIAAHALYSESGREGAILFHPDGDNILSSQEVAALDIDVDKVVLSACASALGKPSWSEGSVGLVDAFIEAGAKAVYATLWSVRDEPTAEFMENVYARLGGGSHDFDGAFQESRRAAAAGILGAALSVPSLWASFVHYGH